MRVAVVTTSWPRFEGDPAGHFVRAEARALARCGDDVVVIAAEGAAFGWPGFGARVKERPLRLAGAAAWVARARAEVNEGGFDRIVAHWAVPCAWPVVGRDGPPLEVVSHGGDVRLLARMPSVARGEVVRRIAARAQTWRFVSRALAEELLGAVRGRVRALVERKLEVRACAIEIDAPSEDAIAEKRARVGEPFAVSVGRLVPDKRVERAIAWAAEQDVPLVVVGDGPQRGALEEEARRGGGRVVFIGKTPRDEALAWMGAAARLVQASEAEGCSTVEREAEALGVEVMRL